VNSAKTLPVTLIGVGLILRLCLDSFTIGQVASLMFLGFSIALYGWITRNPLWTILGLLPPTFLKVGPGFLLGVFLAERNSKRYQAAKIALFGTLIFVLISLMIPLPWPSIQTLWSQWLMIIQNDSNYYDSSHYGSQSIHSFLLRSVKSGSLSPSGTASLELLFRITLCGLVSFLWSFRRATSNHGRGLFFSLGLFIYMLLMPETFKYSLTPLAIPLVLLWISQPRKRWLKIAVSLSLFISACTISLAGKDLLSESIFFGLQTHSIPLLAVFLLGLCTAAVAWEESMSSPLARQLTLALWTPKEEFPLWTKSPQSIRSKGDPVALSLLIPVTLGPGYFSDSAKIIQTLETWHQQLNQELSGRNFETIVIFWGTRISRIHPIVQALEKARLNCTQVLIADHATGASSALRVGFLESRGEHLLVSHLEQPIDPVFLSEWISRTQIELRQGADLVRGNRRHPESLFRIPVRFLALVYGRHQLGLFLNSLVKTLFKTKSQDCAAPHLAFSRRLATEAFAMQRCRGTLFHIELSLVCKNFGFTEKDLPLSVRLSLEKSLSRVFWEALEISIELPKLFWYSLQGCYQPIPSLKAVTADDWGLSPGVNAGILHLARLGIIRRVSIMANCNYLEDGLRELTSIPGVELGLHFNLTYGRSLHTQEPLISSPVRFLIDWIHPWNRSRDKKITWAEAEFLAQIQKLKNLNLSLTYLDGHHHIHLVPGLIQAISKPLKELGIHQVRLPWDPSLWRTPQFPLLILSAWASRTFRKLGLRSLPCFYPSPRLIQSHPDFRRVLRSRVLRQTQSTSTAERALEIIVHPALRNDLATLEFPDSYQSGRVLEFYSLQMLRAQEVSLDSNKESSSDS
jgi:predicted glycoside hydrolase/deacetylase ChbG (UPF0249 family)